MRNISLYGIIDCGVSLYMRDTFYILHRHKGQLVTVLGTPICTPNIRTSEGQGQIWIDRIHNFLTGLQLV